MKKQILLLVFCFVFVFVFSGCSERYKRISFENEDIDEELAKYIDDETEVIYNGKPDFPSQLPIYEISKRSITQDELAQMLKKLGLSAYSDRFDHDDNQIVGNWVPYTDRTRGYFEMSDEELEKLAWETFRKIPFLNGEYEYCGIESRYTISDSEGTHLTRVGVSFRKLVNGLRVLGNDRCYLYFDARGLVEMVIELYDYKEIGTMDLVKFDDAFARIKSPDSFSVESGDPSIEAITVKQPFEALNTEKVSIMWFNQHSKGCTVLQPVYCFGGAASGAEVKDAQFTSLVIAIPESYTRN